MQSHNSAYRLREGHKVSGPCLCKPFCRRTRKEGTGHEHVGSVDIIPYVLLIYRKLGTERKILLEIVVKSNV